MENFQIIVAGAAGQGSKKAGLLIGKLFNFYGLEVFIHEDYESVIRGGHNFSYITVSQENTQAIYEKIDFLLALNEEAILRHSGKLKKGGVLMYDLDNVKKEALPEREDIKKEGVPLGEIIKEAEGIDLMKNTAIVSSFAKSTGMEWEKVSSVLKKELPIETEKNLEVAQVAFKRIERLREMEEGGNKPNPLFSGNEAVALGAVAAGLECYFAYPMTPSTSILNFLSKLQGVRTLQPENEIAVVNAALGAAYSGRRTMVGTSGGGFALMTEGISFAAQAEMPLVIALSQRMGPATGVPTYEAQADLLFAINSGHGDMLRFVTAPGDIDEAFYLAGKSLNVSWKYQMPSIVLLDKELSENTYGLQGTMKVKKEEIRESVEEGNYNRYDGENISPLAFPGGEAVVKVSGYEHDKKGIATEDAEKIKEMHKKRLRKYEKLKEELRNVKQVKTYNEGSVAVVFWGSTKGAVLEAIKGMEVKAIQPIILQPFPEEQMKEALSGAEKIICVENNATGQLAKLMRAHGIEVEEKVLKYDGRPFTVEELQERIKDII